MAHHERIPGFHRFSRFIELNGGVLREHFAHLIGHFGDQVGVDAKAPIGKGAVTHGELQGSDGTCTEGHGEIGRMLFSIKAKVCRPLLGIRCTDGLQDANGDHVLGFGQSCFKGHGAFELAVVVFGLPGL